MESPVVAVADADLARRFVKLPRKGQIHDKKTNLKKDRGGTLQYGQSKVTHEVAAGHVHCPLPPWHK